MPEHVDETQAPFPYQPTIQSRLHRNFFLIPSQMIELTDHLTVDELGLDSRARVVVPSGRVPVADREQTDSYEDDADVIHL